MATAVVFEFTGSKNEYLDWLVELTDFITENPNVQNTQLLTAHEDESAD